MGLEYMPLQTNLWVDLGIVNLTEAKVAGSAGLNRVSVSSRSGKNDYLETNLDSSHVNWLYLLPVGMPAKEFFI